MRKSLKSFLCLALSILFLTSGSVSVFAYSNSDDYVIPQESQEYEQEYLKDNFLEDRGVGGAIAGAMIGAAFGTLTGVIKDKVENNDITLGSVLIDLAVGAIKGGYQGSKLPF